MDSRVEKSLNTATVPFKCNLRAVPMWHTRHRHHNGAVGQECLQVAVKQVGQEVPNAMLGWAGLEQHDGAVSCP